MLSHFPSHVGTHFCRDLAASSFEGPFLFEDEVLARVIAASRKDSNLNAQLSIAKAFKFPVFPGFGNSDWKASSGQHSGSSSSSSSASKGKGSEDSEKKGEKRKASSSPSRSCSSKSPKHHSSPGKGKKNFRK